jgi:membrane fusion protein, multidrug efflux system
MQTIAQFINERMVNPVGVLMGAFWFGLMVSLVAAAALACLRLWRGKGKMERVPRTWGLGVLVLLIAAGAYVTWHEAGAGKPTTKAAAQSGPTPAPVRVAPVEKKPFSVFLTALGTVQPTNMVTIRSRVDGHIEKVAFEEGQMVRAGDLLVQLDAAPFRATLEQAIAKRAQDEASLLNAKQDLQRAIVLTKQGIDAQQMLDQRMAQVAQLTALVQADGAAIESARVQLNYTTIRSPLTGRIGFRLIDPGNIVHVNDQTGMLTITQLQPISVVFTLPQQSLFDVREALHGGPLAVTALNSEGKKQLAQGTLSLIDNQVDSGSGTIRLKASFPNQDNALWPGLSVTVRLLVATFPDAVVVPDTAVQRGPNGLYAFVVGPDGRAQLRRLRIARVADGNAMVEEGLTPGEQLVVSGHYRVQPSAPLRILGTAEATGVRVD